ncbi:MAG: methylenetetrahydrofolate reductase [Methanomassiliicoccales archaeon]
MSSLQRLLSEGRKVVTCELGPPQGADGSPLVGKANSVRGWVDACNLTDCTTAMVRLSSLASSLIVMNAGVEPIMQLTLRDRNRIALQSDLLGASALGIHNILCLYGDPPSAGNEKEARAVYDLTTVQFISCLRKMRDEGALWGGGKLTHPPNFFIGAAAAAKQEESRSRIDAVRAKAEAGAQFFQTQPVFDTDLFASFIEDMRSSGLIEKCAFIAGVMPLRSYRMARNTVEHVPGISIPEEVLQRMETSSDQELEGKRIASEIIRKLQHMDGVAGVHVMTVAWESAIPSVLEMSGLSARSLP